MATANVLKKYPCLEINLPSLFKMPEFVKYLNDIDQDKESALATWHRGGRPDETSDIFIVFDHDESPNSDMPGWDIIVAICEAAGMTFGIVRITNMVMGSEEETG